MTKTILATYDGEGFRPHEPVSLPPNTEVWITIEQAQPEHSNTLALRMGEPYSALEAIASLNLQGPPDWSKRLDKYRDTGVNESGG